ncbi:MAG: TetR/AcrR family transcriptional regulator [Acetatifactor sp.]
MPPKPKCTREEVAAAALVIIKEKGLEGLTARELGRRLGTSASPVFTSFQNMDEVKMAARELAIEEFKDYISDYREYTPAFKRIGMMIVSYGIHQPELFRLLFMQSHEAGIDMHNILQDLGDTADTCIGLLMEDYGMTGEEATLIFEQMWINAFGIGVMCANRVCDFSEEEIGRRLSITFAGLCMFVKSGKTNEIYSTAEKRTDGIFKGRKVGELPYFKTGK